MGGSDETLENLFNRIRKEELTRLALDLVHIPSPTGEKGKLAEFIVDWLRKQNIPAFLQEVEKDRYNAVGRLPGAGNGFSLTSNAHLDTAFSGVEADLPVLGEIRPSDRPRYTSVWNDNNIYPLMGIPAVKWGPSPGGNGGGLFSSNRRRPGQDG
jgi:hypothetical protein